MKKEFEYLVKDFPREYPAIFILIIATLMGAAIFLIAILILIVLVIVQAIKGKKRPEEWVSGATVMYGDYKYSIGVMIEDRSKIFYREIKRETSPNIEEGVTRTFEVKDIDGKYLGLKKEIDYYRKLKNYRRLIDDKEYMYAMTDEKNFYNPNRTFKTVSSENL